MGLADDVEGFIRRGQTAQSFVDELLTVRTLSNAQLVQRLGITVGEFLSRDAEGSAILRALADAVDAFTRELAAAAAARRG